MISKEAKQRASRAYFKRNKNNPDFKRKKNEWNKKWRHANLDRYVSPGYRFSILKAKSKHREVEMGLSFEAYRSLIEGKNCHYCGVSVFSSGSGLDRVDSSKGYVEGNCVPCCYRCNVMKADLNLEDFYEHLELILDYQARKKLAS
jgi:hypothetical protein